MCIKFNLKDQKYMNDLLDLVTKTVKEGLEMKLSNDKQPICHILIKIGEKDHMQSLLNDGKVYMNSTEFFRTNKNEEIGDEYEGAMCIKNGKVSDSRENLDFEKLFCMWHINNINPVHDSLIHRIEYDKESDSTRMTIDLRKLSNFTPNEESYAVVINNVREFNRRFKLACEKNKLQYHGNKVVKYYDPEKISEETILTPFWKRNSYDKQQEIRYFIEIANKEALKLYLGPLNDIATIINVNETAIIVQGECK